jgi:uncharacterized protein (DUF433 family)
MSSDDAQIFEARYDITSAAHHLRMPRSTLAAWAQGQGEFKQVLELPKPGYLSFVNLTEAFVLYAMRRRYKIKLPNIRIAIDYIETEMKVAHPLAFQPFRTDHVDLFVKTAVGDVNASKRGQTLMQDVLEGLNRIEWRGDRPIALFPVIPNRENDESRPIRISPLIAFGKPVLSGTRVPTRVVFERFYGGESVEDLASDYALSTDAIEEAVRAETEPTAA